MKHVPIRDDGGYGKTPMATFVDTAQVARDKLLPAA